MVRDKSLEEVFETVLYRNGVKDSWRIAGEIYEEYIDWMDNVWPKLAMAALDASDDGSITFKQIKPIENNWWSEFKKSATISLRNSGWMMTIFLWIAAYAVITGREMDGWWLSVGAMGFLMLPVFLTFDAAWATAKQTYRFVRSKINGAT